MKVDPGFAAYTKRPKTPEAELVDRGGDLGGLVGIAKAIRAAAEDVARSIESYAWDRDRERRGALSVGARQDATEVAGTIKDLLGEQLLSERDRDDLARHVRAMVDPEGFGKTWPAEWDAEMRRRAGMPPLSAPGPIEGMVAFGRRKPKKGRKARRARR